MRINAAVTQAHAFPFHELVRFYDFDQIDGAFEDSKRGGAIKPVLRIP